MARIPPSATSRITFSLGLFVVARDEHVQRLTVDLSGQQRAGEVGVEGLDERRALGSLRRDQLTA
jgi:hypothetical protein